MVEKKTAFCVRFVDSDHTAAYTHTYQKKKSKTVKREKKENTDNIQKKKKEELICVGSQIRQGISFYFSAKGLAKERKKEKRRAG